MRSTARADESWVALHVFSYGDLDRLLADALAPVLRDAVAAGEISRFFYVRFWNGGPHVRLRLAGAAPAAVGEIIERARAFIAAEGIAAWPPADFAQRVGPLLIMEQRADAPATHRAEIPEAQHTGPPVERRPYEFAAARYGGMQVRDIVEGHFCASSQLALAVVEATLGRPTARFRFALHLAAAAPAALGLAQRDALGVIDDVRRMFATYVCPDSDTDPIASHGYVPYADQAEELAELVAQFETGLPLAGFPDTANGWLARWEQELTECAERFRVRARRGDFKADVRFVIFDFVHMMNNRLGIPAGDEMYLYYLLGGALDAAASAPRQRS